MELRMRVRKSATGSVRFIHSPSFPVRFRVSLARTSGNVAAVVLLKRAAVLSACCVASRLLHPKRSPKDNPDEVSGVSRQVTVYQLDLTTPGISPLSARLRKQRRQQPNLRRSARGRPQSWQRLCWRDLNFGFLASLTRFAVVAIVFALYPCYKFCCVRRPSFAP